MHSQTIQSSTNHFTMYLYSKDYERLYLGTFGEWNQTFGGLLWV